MATTLAVTPLKEESTREQSERLGAEITELCSYIYAAEHRFLTLIRKFDEQRGWAWLGFHTCAHWLNFNCGMGMNAARERVRVAHALGNLPKIDARFASGALSYSKVRAMTRIADESNEDYLLMIAKHGTAYHVEKLVSKYRRVVRLNDADAVRTLYDNRQLSCYYDHDGSLVIKGRFSAEQGALIVNALEMAMEKSFADVSAETSRRIGCDCSLLGIREGENGEPLSIGRKTRSIPPAMRRALRLRDGGCRFPGCTNDRFEDGHHIQHWADGGETSLDNLVLLCRRHHHLVHEGGFTCEKTRDGEILFHDQQQIPLPNWSVMPTIGEDDINEWLDRQFFEDGTGPEGCNAHWYAGDRMDWNLAVGHLFV